MKYSMILTPHSALLTPHSHSPLHSPLLVTSNPSTSCTAASANAIRRHRPLNVSKMMRCKGCHPVRDDKNGHGIRVLVRSMRARAP